MAEETIDGAQNLSSQNQFDQLTGQSDFLDPAKIEQPLDPTLKWQDNFSNPTNFIKDGTAGISPNVPPSAINQLSQQGAMSPFASMIAKQQQNINSLTDYSNYAEPYAYDASPTGTFRDRYKAYGQETYNKVGFSPLIDNETWYNQNTTFGDDLKRWATHSAWPMFTKGLLDPIKSYKSVMDGDGLFYADPQGARDYQYYNAIGQSTKGGIGAFTVNLLNSASYSLGILTEGAMEGALIGSLFGEGAAGGATTAGRKLLNLPKGFANLAKGTAKLLDDVQSYSNLAKAKEYWARAGTNFGNFWNPLQNTTTALQNTNNLSNLARSTTTAGAFWHDVMAMNLALSEGKLEGGFTKYELYDKLYNKFVEEHKGRAPSLKEQEDLMKLASKGSWWNTHNNTALIYYTNKLVFPSITKASFLKGMPKFAFGKTFTTVGKEYQILFEGGSKALEGQFVKQKINLVNALKSLGKPSTYGKVGLNYFKANVMEGFQEVAQDVLQESTQNIVLEGFYNPDARNFRYSSGIVGDAIAKQWSAQGLEVFLSGFLMGTILQAPGKIKTYATIGYNDYFKKDSKFRKYMEDRTQMADDIVTELNTLYKNANYFFDPRINNYAQQGLVSKVVDNPEEHTTKDIRDTEFAAFQSALYSSLERGTFDMFLKHYQKFEQASASDIEEAWNLEPGQGQKALERFGKSMQHAEKVAFRYNKAKDKMKEFRLDLNNYEKDTEAYRMAQVYNKSFNLALNTYTFLHESYDNNLERVNSLFEKFSKITALGTTPMNNISVLVDPQGLVREIEMLKTDIESLESVTTQEAIAELSKKRELLELYTKYNDNLEEVYKLFTNKELLNAKIAEIENADSTDVEDEKIRLEIYRTIVDEFQKGLTKTDKTFKESFNELLIGLADTNEDRLKVEQGIEAEGGIDDLYDALLDTMLLRNENSILNQYTTLIASPNGFYDHVIKNFDFMKKLYNNREEIIQDIVNQEISAIERNSLLNTLSDQGIFLDLDEFAKWIENHNYYPEYFIDVKNNRMITKGSLIYEDYMEILHRAAELDEKKPAGEKIDLREKLDRRISELIAERDGLIQKEKDKYYGEFKDKYGVTPDEYIAEQEKTSTGETLTEDRRKELEEDKKILENAIEALKESTDWVAVQAAAEVVADKIMSKDKIKAPIWFSEQIDIAAKTPEKKQKVDELIPKYSAEDVNQNIDAALKSLIYGEWAVNKLSQVELELNKKPASEGVALENTKEYLKFQEVVTAITEKYDEFIQQVKEDFEKEGVDENTPKVYSTKTDFNDFDKEYQKEITDEFDKYLVDVLEEPIELKDTEPIKYEKLRKNWLESQSQLINNINEKSELKSEEKAKKLAEPPMLTFIKRQLSNEDTTYEIAQIIKVFEKFLKDGEYPSQNNPNKKIPLKITQINQIKSDIESMQGYLKARVDASAPRTIAEETVNLIQDNVVNKQDELEPVFDKDGNQTGRKFKDSKIIPERTTKVAEEIENDVLNNSPYIYFGIRDEIDAETGEVLKKSPVEQLYDRIFNDPDVAKEDRVSAFMTAFEERVYGKGTRENPGFRAFAYPEKIAAIENSLKTDGSYEGLFETMKREAHRESSDSGNVVDDLIRIFLTPNASTKSNFSEFEYDSDIEIKGRMTRISDVMSRKAFDKLFAPIKVGSSGGVVTKFRLGIVDGSYMILSENVKLFDRTLRDDGITGELDLILVREDGSVAIVDIKTSTKAKWEKFGTGEGYEKSLYFRAQQSIYGYMFHNSTGITPELKLMPFSVKLSSEKVGYIEDIDLADIVPTGQDTIDLEYLPEIEEFGIIKTTPENIIIRETIKVEPGYEGTDTSKITLEDNIDRSVMYKGSAGTLIRMKDGSFAIKVAKVDKGIENVMITLEALKADLKRLDTVSSGNVTDAQQSLVKDIARLEEFVKSRTKDFEIYPLQNLNTDTDILDGKLTLADVGLQIIAPVENIGQVSIIEGEVIDVKFNNKDETEVIINGVKHQVNRDNTGAITSLQYMNNDSDIVALDKVIDYSVKKLSLLRDGLNEATKDETQRFYLDKIAELKGQIRSANKMRKTLYDTNVVTYLYGSNADNYIFAINKLPNNFQKITKKTNNLDEIQDLKTIDQLSLSSAISQAITEILAEQYPEALDKLLEGDVKSLNSNDILKIDNWAEQTIERLYNLGYSVINRGDLTDDIQNQINALLELKNDLGLIKLTKNGKIRNFKKVEKWFTGQEKVPKGTNLSENASTKSSKSKNIPGPSTKKELQEIIKRSRGTSDFELIPKGDQSTKTDSTKSNIDELVQKISNAKLNNIEAIYQKAVLEALDNGQKTTPLTDAWMNRLIELNTLVSLETINTGEHLISKNSIFNDKVQSIYSVVRINKQSVRLKNILSLKENTLKEEELVNLEKITMEATKPKSDVEIDELDLQGSSESKDVVKELTNDKESTDKAKENARKSDVTSRFQQLKNNAKEC